ncbi:MAG: hypothetical protein WD468_04500 [Pirellulales bacterium]
MIIWSGYGYLVAVIVFGTSLLMEVLTERWTGDDNFYQTSTWALPAALVIAGMVSWLCDWLLKPEPGVQNSLFFVPMKWWAPLLFVIAIAMLIF